MICGEIDKDQLQFLESIYETKTHIASKKLTGIISEILAYSSEDIMAALGQFGINLAVLSSYINPNIPHPDIFSICNGELTSTTEGSFSRDAGDVLRLVSHGKRLMVSTNILDNLKKFVTKHKSYESLLKIIDDPWQNLQNIRFVQSRKQRDSIRANKRVQSVHTELLYKRGFQFCMSEPSDFVQYKRGACMYQSDIAEARSRHQHFSDLGLSLMASEIQTSIEQLQKQSDSSQYFGFNKISLTSACVILAKQSGYLYYAKHPDEVGGDKILVDPKSFKYRFFAEDQKNSLFDDSHFLSELEFAPRVYTYGELEPYASDEVKLAVNHLEVFPEALGYSLFDHYRVLVPSINYPLGSQSASCRIRLPNGDHFNSSLQNVQMRLDVELLKQNEIVGILLGEKDGDCYFISYFR